MVAPDTLRFAAGWRLLEPAGEGEAAPTGETLHVDVIRAADLVALSVSAVDCELVAGGDSPPALRPIQGKNARLVVTFPYQHLAEEAVYEGRAAPSDAPHRKAGDLRALPKGHEPIAGDVEGAPVGTLEQPHVSLAVGITMLLQRGHCLLRRHRPI